MEEIKINQVGEIPITRFERCKIVYKRLSKDIKALFGNSAIVLDLSSDISGKKERILPLDQRADIVVQVNNEVDDVRKFLQSENDIVIIKEGPGLVLNSEDTSFYLRLIEQKEKPKMALDRLKTIFGILDSIKLEGNSYMREEEAVKKSLLKGSVVPVTTEGDNGVRLSYNQELDMLKVLFTRGFKDKDNPKRKELEELLKQNFTDVEVEEL